MTTTPILLLLDALAVIRLTQLVNHDTILDPVRDWLIGHSYGETRDMSGARPAVAARPKWAVFLTCPWCVSFWAAIGVVAAQALIPHLWLYGSAVLAFSAVCGLVAELR
jgi:hypothetical protein